VRRDDRGFITLWVLGLTVAVLFLGGLGVDLWRAIAVRREVSAMADAAATAGANGLDESALRGGRLEVDPARARRLVAAGSLAHATPVRLVRRQRLHSRHPAEHNCTRRPGLRDRQLQPRH